MVFGLIAAAFLISTEAAPLDTALARSEPPISMRAAFTVEMTDGTAFREIHFDPRLPNEAERWSVVSSTGKSRELDLAVSEWGKQSSPDGWLFADDLRASMGSIVEAEDMGAAWRIHFQHHASENDGPLDVWAADHLAGSAWLEPVNSQFLRIDYTSFEPFDGPKGGKIESYSHSYMLGQDAEYGITYVSAFKVDVQGSFLNARIERAYRVKVKSVEFFFASKEEEARYRQQQKKLRNQTQPLYVSSK